LKSSCYGAKKSSSLLNPQPTRHYQAFSKIKNLIRKAQARGREALIEAIGAAISALSAQDARGFFEHCGYRSMVQLF